jgi:hypothetical protein
LSTGWVGSALGIIGIALAIYFYFRTKVNPSIAFQTGGVRLIGEHAELPQEVSVSFREVPVRALTTSTAIVWNNGNTTIEGSAIVSTDPVRLTFGDATQILSTEVLKASRDAIRFATRADAGRSEVFVSFEFLDPGDGAVIKVLHTGANLHAVARGTVKGMPRGLTDLGTLATLRFRNRKRKGILLLLEHQRAVAGMMAVVGCAIAGAGLFPGIVLSILPDLGKPSDPTLALDKIAWPIVIPGILYVVMGCFFLYSDWRRYPRSLEVGRTN